MRSILKTGLFVLMLAAALAAQAGTLEGVAIGAGTGAVVAGPVGAVAGGVIGGVVGGPNIVHHRHHRCWTNANVSPLRMALSVRLTFAPSRPGAVRRSGFSLHRNRIGRHGGKGQ